MSFVTINPAYVQFLNDHGICQAEQFIELPSVVISGHPDRHVARVTLGTGGQALPALIKREHRVRLKDRLLNSWEGFGFVSKSRRESETLLAVARNGIACPEWLAHGETNDGRAFLLVREITNALPLAEFLRHRPPADVRSFVQRLGYALARLHNAGFDHPDLYAKHVLVQPDEAFYFLDWQRTRPGRVDWQRRARDLAALSATLPDDLVRRPERAACLRAYLRACRQDRAIDRVELLQIAYQIFCKEKLLLARRRIREMREPAIAVGRQRVIWADGEAVCLTEAFREEMAGGSLDWLKERQTGAATSYNARIQYLPTGRSAWLIQRSERRVLRSAWAWLTGRRLESAELVGAGLIFRLERHGVQVPELLAFGQHQSAWNRLDSFLLTALPEDVRELGAWLLETPPTVLGGRLQERRRDVIRQAGALVRRLHDAAVGFDRGKPPGGAHAGRSELSLLLVQEQADGVVVRCGAVDLLRARKRNTRQEVTADLVYLRNHFGIALASKSDELRFLLSYFGIQKATAPIRRIARRIVRKQGRQQSGERPRNKPGSPPPHRRRASAA